MGKKYLSEDEHINCIFIKKGTTMEKIKNVTQSGGNSKKILSILKYAYYQYKSDLRYVKHTSRIWKQKPYRFFLTELSILWHNIYWRVIKI